MPILTGVSSPIKYLVFARFFEICFAVAANFSLATAARAFIMVTFETFGTPTSVSMCDMEFRLSVVKNMNTIMVVSVQV